MNAAGPARVEGRENIASARFAENMASLLDLEHRARIANTYAELAFVMVNDSFRLFSFRQAIFLGRLRRGRKHFSVSGLSGANEDSPYSVWAKAVLRHLDTHPDRTKRNIRSADLPPALAAEWDEWLPAALIVLPISYRGVDLGVLAFARDKPASEAELRLLGVLSEAYAHAWEAVVRGRQIQLQDLRPSRSRMLALFGAVAIAALGFLPVPITVLAPAQVVARDSAILRSPIDAVVEEVLVAPNEPVVVGQPLIRFDGRRISSQLDAARLAVVAVESELQQTRQLSLSDPQARLRLPVLQGQLDQRLSEVQFLEQQLARLIVLAPTPGLALYENRSELVGRPITIGERLIEVADPNNIQVEIWLSLADAIALESKAPIRLFLNVDPGVAIDGNLEFMSYIPSPSPDGMAAYRILASLSSTHSMLRVGLQGTVRIYGESVTLAYYVFRRPLAAVRMTLGL
jgi:hypothetical protein